MLSKNDFKSRHQPCHNSVTLYRRQLNMHITNTCPILLVSDMTKYRGSMSCPEVGKPIRRNVTSFPSSLSINISLFCQHINMLDEHSESLDENPVPKHMDQEILKDMVFVSFRPTRTITSYIFGCLCVRNGLNFVRRGNSEPTANSEQRTANSEQRTVLEREIEKLSAEKHLSFAHPAELFNAIKRVQ
uniref:Uncharacterized protein n=1 Tax=Glossina austeni TaxID=7395 RepID=A0A1A9VYY1_GLOAU